MILPQFNRIMKKISMRKSDEKSGPPFENRSELYLQQSQPHRFRRGTEQQYNLPFRHTIWQIQSQHGS